MQQMLRKGFSIRNRSSLTNVKLLKNFSTRDLFPGGFFYLSIFILLLAFGVILLSQTIWDYDFWWHIATGRYIVETRSIPVTDPFSFTSQLPENNNLYPLRERFILSQYWLAQIIFYFLYHNFGPAGIGIMRAALLVGTIYAIYRALKGRDTMPYITYLSLFLAYMGLLRALGERPVLFTILFSVVCFVFLDDYVRKRSKTLYFLPLLMLLWANLHGGFILGDAIIIIFVVAEGMRVLLKQGNFSHKEYLIFCAVSLLSLGLSGINPNGFLAFDIAFSKEYAPFYVGIQEYQSPFLLYKLKIAPPDYGYLAALLLFPAVLVLRNKKFNLTHLVLLVFLTAESAMAGRFTVYYCVISALVLGNELDLWLKEHHENFIVRQKHLNIFFSFIMIASSLLYFVGMVNLKTFKIRESAWTVPKGAVDFLEKNHIKGNVLNDMGAGGYLSWRLYPEIKTFIDSRSLNYTVMKEYTWIATTTESIYNPVLPPGKIPLWKRLLEHYQITTVAFSPVDIYGNLLPLAIKLLDEKNWAPVFADIKTVIFIKNVPENEQIIKKFRMTDEEVLNTIIIKATLFAQSNKVNPLAMESLGDIFQRLGRKADAIKAYEYSLKRKPDNPTVKDKLDKLIKEESEAKK